MDKTLTMPSVHINGTGSDALLKPIVEAIRSLDEATRMLGHAAPNARDYYVQGDHAFGAAAAEHRARIAKLREVRDELLAVFDHIDAQPRR